MATPILKPIYFIESLGEYGLTPDGAILNIGGTAGPTFTVGGKALIFADGTTSDGDISYVFKPDLQAAYNNSSTPAITTLTTNKDIVWIALNGEQLVFDADTGDLRIGGLINGIDIVGLSDRLEEHLAFNDTAKHTASDISVNTNGLDPVTGANVQEAIESIASVIKSLDVDPAGNIRGYEHTQIVPSDVWTIEHGGISRRIQITVWDNADEMIYTDSIEIADINTVIVTFSTPATGRAILMLF
jgi:hypothetical protein